MTYTEWKKKKSEDTDSTADAHSTAGKEDFGGNKTMCYTQWKEKKLREQKAAGNTVQGWAQESGALIEKAQTSVDSWFDQTQYESQTSALSHMITQADGWRSIYAGDDRMLESIDSVVNALNSAKEHVTGHYDYYSLWDSAEAYNTAEQNYQWEQTYQGKSYDELTGILAGMEEGEEKEWLSSYMPLVRTQADYDNEIAELQAQIEEMGEFYDQAYAVESWYTDYSTSAEESRTDPQTDAANLKIYNELVEKYGTLEDLEASIQQKKLLIKQTERAKEHNQLFSVMNPYSENYDPEFAAKSTYVSTTGQSPDMGYYDVSYEDFYGQSNGQQVNGILDITYECVNGNEDVIALYGDDSLNYHYMNEAEIALYNYYYATEGKTTAERYLDLIQETLNQRAAEESYEDYEGDTFKEIIFGAEAGWDQFKSGMKNFFNYSDNYIPVSETQLLAEMVRDDLANDSIPMWYNMKTGQWEEKVFGNSAGQLAFDTVNTTSNVLPSVLTSTAINMVAPGVGSAVGAGMMGMSSAGNAYQEMLNLGYDRGQARAYSTLVGAAEAGLSYAISGIGKLGGEISNHWIRNTLSSVDKAFAQVALKLGGNMVSEGAEEMLTELLTPMFKNMTLNMNEDVDWGQVAYSGLMGAMTANLFEGPGVIAEHAGHYRTGKALQTAGISAEQLAAVGKLSADEAVQQLADRVDENTGAYTLGRLFYEMGAVLTDSNKAQIAAALEAEGVLSEDAEVMTEALATVMEGASLTDEQIQMLEANDTLSRAAMVSLDTDPSAFSEAEGVVVMPEERTVAPTAEQLLQQAIDSVDTRPMNPRIYNELNAYSRQLQHLDTTQRLLDQKKSILQQQQASGAPLSQIQQTQTDIAKLEKMLATQKQKLQKAQQSPALQKVIAQHRTSTNDTDPDSSVMEYIGKSVGAKAKNYNVYDPQTGSFVQLAEDTSIIQPKNHVLAGKGRVRQIDCVDWLVDKYGGSELQWTKEMGYGYIVDEYGEMHCVELHWYQEPSIGKVEMKIKYREGSAYLDE